MSFAVSLVFAGGFETDYVSRHRTVVPCTLRPCSTWTPTAISDRIRRRRLQRRQPTIYTGAPELNDGIDNECPGKPRLRLDRRDPACRLLSPGRQDEFTWHTQSASSYTVARPTGRISIVHTFTLLGTFTDPEEPPSGIGFYYLVRPAAPRGGVGARPGGAERTVSCPWPQ
jgi:hypothetical protein